MAMGFSHSTCFAQHVLAGLERGDRALGVRGVGGADTHGVDLGVGEKILEGVVGTAAVLGRKGAGALDVHVKEADELGVGVCLVLGDVADLRDLSAADDADPDHCDLLVWGAGRPVPLAETSFHS